VTGWDAPYSMVDGTIPKDSRPGNRIARACGIA
jgi:hypothetical protein